MSSLDLIYITNKPELALNAQSAGVDRIMVDLEILGKEERQGHLNTVMSRHSIDDIVKVRNVLDSAKVQVRVNPIHDGSRLEIEKVIESGAEIIMLPMFHTSHEVKDFINIVDGRVKTCLLLETAAAFARLDRIISVPGIDEIHIGLNDLHLSMNLSFMFELMCGDLLDYLGNKIKNKGIRFGIGGIGTLFTNEAVPARLILSEHARLGSSMVILSRSFHQNHKVFSDCSVYNSRSIVGEIKEEYNLLYNCAPLVLKENKLILENCVKQIVDTTVPKNTIK